MRTGGVGSALQVAALFLFAAREYGFRSSGGRIFLLCGQKEWVPPFKWPHFFKRIEKSVLKYVL
jgi:hypothetical protein